MTESPEYSDLNKSKLPRPVGAALRLSLAISILTACAGKALVDTQAETLHQGDPGYEVQPLPGYNILDILGPQSMYVGPDGLLSGNPIHISTGPDDPEPTAWGDFPCTGLGCPRTLVFDSNGMPGPQSCVLGYSQEWVDNPNYDPTNPYSLPKVPRYFPNNNVASCSVSPAPVAGSTTNSQR